MLFCVACDCRSNNLFIYLLCGDGALLHADDYLSQECSQNFINCMNNFRNSGAHTFKGNKCQVDEVIDVISVVMEAALLAGRALHKP